MQSIFVSPINDPRYDRQCERARGRGLWHIIREGPIVTLCGRDASGWQWDWEGKVTLASGICETCLRAHRAGRR